MFTRAQLEQLIQKEAFGPKVQNPKHGEPHAQCELWINAASLKEVANRRKDDGSFNDEVVQYLKCKGVEAHVRRGRRPQACKSVENTTFIALPGWEEKKEVTIDALLNYFGEDPPGRTGGVAIGVIGGCSLQLTRII